MHPAHGFLARTLQEGARDDDGAAQQTTGEPGPPSPQCCRPTPEEGPKLTAGGFPVSFPSPVHMIIVPLDSCGPGVLPSCMAEEVLQTVPEDALVLEPVPKPSRVMVYEAIIACKGNISKVCETLHSRRVIINDIINSTPAIAALRDEFREAIIDRSEDNLFADVEKGDNSTSRFIVQSLGKHRGWAQGVEGTGKNGAITVEITRFEEAKGG